MLRIIAFLFMAGAGVTALVPAASALPQCTDPGIVVAVHAETGEPEGQVPAGQVFEMQYWLLNDEIDDHTLGGFEFSREFLDEFGNTVYNIFVLQTQCGPPSWGGINFGSNGNYLVGFQTPSPMWGEPMLLVTETLLYPSPGCVYVHLGPSNPPTVPGVMSYVGSSEPDELLTMYPASEDFDDPVASINCDGDLGICDLEIDLAVAIAVTGDGGNEASTAYGATDGYDVSLDVMADGDSRLHFPHPEWSVPPPYLFDIDMRAPFDPLSEVKIWTFEVETEVDQSWGSEPVQLFFDPSFMAGDGIELRLYDHTDGVTAELFPNLQYNYTAYDTEVRTFDLMVGAAIDPNIFDVAIRGYSSYADVDEGNVASTNYDATDGWDPLLDIPEPGPPPYDYFLVWFNQPGWPLGPRFRTDAREPYDPFASAKIWPLTVETSQSGNVHLEFTPSFSPNDGIGLVLHDLSTGESHNLFPELEYVYSDWGGYPRDFELRIGSSVPPDLDPPNRFLADGWSMIGLPLEPLPGATLDDVVLSDMYPWSYGYIYGQDVDGAYEYLESSVAADRGRGYWVGATDEFFWDMAGLFHLEPVTVPLNHGFNMVGYPLWFPGSLNGVQVEYMGNTYTWQQAIDQWLVNPNVYGFDTGANDYYTVSSLHTWNGYWFRAHQQGVSLIFDWTHLATAAPLAKVTGGVDYPTGQDWAVDLVLTSPDGPYRSVRCGVNPDASDGYDARFDAPQPPPAPVSAGFSLLIERDDWGEQDDRLLRQELVRPDLGEFSWNLIATADEPGTYQLTWTPDDWPVDLDLVIYQSDVGRVVVPSLSEGGSLSLELGAGPVELRLCSANLVTATPDADVFVDQLQAVPNPFNPMTTFALDLARGGDVEIVVYNLRGQAVRTLSLGRCVAGRHQVNLDGRDDQGRVLASGTYLAAVKRDGQRTEIITKISLVR